MEKEIIKNENLKLSKEKEDVMFYFDELTSKRLSYVNKNKYYYDDLKRFLKYNVSEKRRVLEIGCGLGDMLKSVNPEMGMGIDISEKMIERAKEKNPDLNFLQMDGENLSLDQKFDYVIISDTLSYFEDIQKVFFGVKRVCDSDTRVIITFHNFLWLPFLKLAELFGLKMPQKRLNWLNKEDIENLLYLEDFEVIKSGRRFLFPKYVPLVSSFFNRYVANLPIINKLCLTGYIIARKTEKVQAVDKELSISIVIPARNEKGNIESAIKRIPDMGKHVEIIFVEGNSTDDTYEEIKRVYEKYKNEYDIKYTKQEGKGKGDAVRKGFKMATGDILMILDADLTTPPEDMPKFYNAIAKGKGEFINGSRLVYPMEKEAMRFLNILGNKFFSVMFSWLLGQRLKDTLCGTKVLTNKNYKELIANRAYFGDFDPFGDFDLIFGASKLNLKIVEVPIKYRSREYGDTNISRFSHGWLLLKMVVFAMFKIKFVR